MEILWDKEVAEQNFQKYGVRFSDTITIFFDTKTLELGETLIDGGRKYVAIGLDQLFRITVMTYDFYEDHVKITAARLATPAEKQVYESRI